MQDGRHCCPITSMNGNKLKRWLTVEYFKFNLDEKKWVSYSINSKYILLRLNDKLTWVESKPC